MPRVHPIFSNFTAGELSPLIDARLDFAKYSNGAKIVENFIIRPHGPLIRRAGFHYVGTVKDSTKNVRVFRFEFNVTQVYALEVGPGWIRFYSQGGQVLNAGNPLEVSNPYLNSEIWSLKTVQSADTIYFFHPAHPVFKLVRHAALNWTFQQVNWLPPPTKEVGQVTDVGSGTPWAGITATLGATSGNGVTLTASAAYFTGGNDVGRVVYADDGVGVAVITAYTSSTVVTVNIIIPFTSVNLSAGPPGWRMASSPQTTSLTPASVGAVNAQVVLTGGNLNTFTSNDVGRYILGNKGVWQIITYTDSNHVVGLILQVPNDATAMAAGAWTLEDPEWSTLNGWPSVGMFHEGRLIAASTQGNAGVAGPATRPTSVWGSQSGSVENFARSSFDNGSFEFRINSEQVNVVKWIISARELLLGTADGEMRMTGGSNAGSSTTAITPTNVNVKAETGFGASDVRAIRINNAALFVTRSGKEVREYVYNLQFDAYVANDLMLLSQHLTENYQILDMDYQRTPHSIVWCVRSDGTLLSLTYAREHDVVGWVRHITGGNPTLGTESPGYDITQLSSPFIPKGYTFPGDGLFKSVAVTPHWNLNGDVVWAVIQRTINGATVQTVEYMDEQFGSFYGQYPDNVLKALFVDCGLTFTAPLVNQTLTLGQSGVGYGITATAGGGTPFSAGMVGYEIRENYGGTTGGRATILSYTDPTHVTVQIIKAFSSANLLANGWLIAVTAVVGATQLPNTPVAVLGDGAPYPTLTVSGDGTGTVNWGGLAPPADHVEIGLPYTSTLMTMRPETPLQGTSQGRQRHWAEVITRLRHTLGATVNGIDLPMRGSQDVMDVPPPIFNGDYKQKAVEINTDGFILVQQKQPLPLTVVGIFGTQGIGE